MCRGFVLAAVAPGSNPGQGTICCVSLPPSLILFPVISWASSINKGQKNSKKKNKWKRGHRCWSLVFLNPSIHPNLLPCRLWGISHLVLLSVLRDLITSGQLQARPFTLGMKVVSGCVSSDHSWSDLPSLHMQIHTYITGTNRYVLLKKERYVHA